MKDVDIFGADQQISHENTISTIKQIFNDEIKHCRQDIDPKLAEYLENFKNEFLFLFPHVFKDKEFKNPHRSGGTR